MTDSGAVQTIALSAIRFVQEAWPRENLDGERVEEFAALFRELGLDALPPLDLVAAGDGTFRFGDGVHRATAVHEAGLTEVRARVLVPPPGGDALSFAYRHALACAAFAAKPLTRAEKQAAIRRLLEEQPQTSDREIARLVGVDHKTVGRLRRGEVPGGDVTWPQTRSPEVVARQLFRGFEKAYEARGLGIGDFFSGDRTGERLAAVLADVYGERALERARRFQAWLEQAIEALEGPDA